MSVLLFQLSAPMQAWGVQSRFRDRDTGREPSKSGVIGLLCAALGRPRWDPLDDLVSLRMGVRVDREGIFRIDYHTASLPGSREATISPRAYLSDAAFLVGLQGDNRMLDRLDSALSRPVWQLFLGRKAFPPAAPVRLLDGLQSGALDDVLRARPLLSGTAGLRRVVLDDPDGPEVRPDVPLSFARRQFATRSVRTEWWEVA